MHLCGRALQSEFRQRNGVDAHMLALLFAPIVLRGARHFRFSDLDEASFRRFPIVGHTPIRQRFPPDVSRVGITTVLRLTWA